MKNHIIKILVAFSFIVATISYADVFNTLNYSGRIVNSDGSPKTGSVDLEINFFDSQSGGSQKGTTYLFSATTLTNGSFNLEIVISDSDIPTVLDSSTDTYIEVTDTTNSKIYPRQKNKLSTLLSANWWYCRLPTSSRISKFSRPDFKVERF